MPGFNGNQSVTDRDIKDIMSYVGNAFSNKSKSVTLERIKELRKEKSKSGTEYTEEELLQLGRSFRIRYENINYDSLVYENHQINKVYNIEGSQQTHTFLTF